MRLGSYCDPASKAFDAVRHVACDRRVYTSFTDSIKDGCRCPCHAGELPTHYTRPALTDAQRQLRLVRLTAVQNPT